MTHSQLTSNVFAILGLRAMYFCWQPYKQIPPAELWPYGYLVSSAPDALLD
jgi:hypothetical protein